MTMRWNYRFTHVAVVVRTATWAVMALAVFLLASGVGGQAQAADAQASPRRVNLVPDRASESSLNYWCTWSAQHPMWYIKTDEELKTFDFLKATEGGNAARRRMDQAALFEDPGWATRYWTGVRSELYFCLDDGWDVPYAVDAQKERWRFGSLILERGAFPRFQGHTGRTSPQPE